MNADLSEIKPSWVLLSDLKKGMIFIIKRVADKSVHTQLIRFGIGEGSRAQCHEKIPFGPIVIKHHRQEVALGRELASEIWVELVSE
jgi:Fe2+ transport system protein FeoA